MELYRYLRASLHGLEKSRGLSSGAEKGNISSILKSIKERHFAILATLEKLREADGHDPWRVQEGKDLGNLVQQRIGELQNPQGKGCKNPRFLSFRLDSGCGLGCLLHHAVYCLAAAYQTGRVLVLESPVGRYSNKNLQEGKGRNGVEYVDAFLPLSRSVDHPF